MSDKSNIKPKIGVVVPPESMFCKGSMQDGEKRCAIGWLIEYQIAAIRGGKILSKSTTAIATEYGFQYGFGPITYNDLGLLPGPEILRRLIALSDDLIEIPAVGPTNE